MTFLFITTCLLSYLLVLAHCTECPFEDQNREKGFKVNSFDISPCEKTADGCTVIQGTNVTVTVRVTNNSNDTLNGMKLKVTAMGVMEYPLPSKEVCPYTTPPCPVGPGQSATFSRGVPVMTLGFPITADISIKILTPLGELTFYFTTNVRFATA